MVANGCAVDLSGYLTMACAENNYSRLGHIHNYAAADHTHNYAATNHTHSEYAASDHTHSTYALTSHTHSNYSLTTHNHDSVYSKLGHTHSFNDYGCAICKLKCAIRTIDTYLSTIYGPLTDVNCAEFYAPSSPYLCGGKTLLESKGFSCDYYGDISTAAAMASHENTIISE